MTTWPDSPASSSVDVLGMTIRAVGGGLRRWRASARGHRNPVLIAQSASPRNTTPFRALPDRCSRPDQDSPGRAHPAETAPLAALHAATPTTSPPSVRLSTPSSDQLCPLRDPVTEPLTAPVGGLLVRPTEPYGQSSAPQTGSLGVPGGTEAVLPLVITFCTSIRSMLPTVCTTT